MNRTLLFLGAQAMQLAPLQTARDMGLRIVAVDPDPEAPGRGLAHRFVNLDLAEVAALSELAKAESAAGVFTMAADFPIPSLAAVCEALGLPGPSPQTALRCTHKARMREALVSHRVPCPVSRSAAGLNGFLQSIRDMPMPCIVKPADSSGGRGVTCFASKPSDAELRDAYAKASGFGRSQEVVFEEAVEGPEFSIEAITVAGETHILGVTDKLTSGAPFFVEIGHNQPSRRSETELQALREITVQTIAALGIDNSASHTEVVLTKDGPRVIESACRLGGGYINSHLLPMATGISIVEAAIRVAIADDPGDLQPPPRTEQAGAAIRFLTPAPGRIEAIQGVDAARAMDGVQEVVLHAKVGDTVHTLSDATSRVGHIIARGRDAADAIAIAERARDRILLDTTTAGASSVQS